VTRTVVMKFGGTSVQDPEALGRLITIVDGVASAGARPVVVVSALGGITDLLLSLATLAIDGGDARPVLTSIRTRHEAMLPMLGTGGRRDAVEAAIVRAIDDLAALHGAIATLGEASPRSLDTLAATGELLSSRIVAAAFEAAGVRSQWFDARTLVVTDAQFTAAVPRNDLTGERCQAALVPALGEGRLPVIGGFIGATSDGATTTLGRGGSDYSAAIVGAAIAADEIQIWTDVDGMLTADPRVIPDARVVPELSFDEASELAYFGAKVLHPSTILPAVSSGIPVRILNSRAPQRAGSRITQAAAGSVHGLTAIACKRGVTRIDIASTRMLMAHGFLQRVFEVFARHRTAVDVVTTSEVSVSVTIDDARAVDRITGDLSAFADVQVVTGRAIVCAVGDRMATDATLSARVIASLEGMPLEMISQGGSRRNVTLVVPDALVREAMQRLHARFFAATGAEAVPA
jgi:aspartate kinase